MDISNINALHILVIIFAYLIGSVPFAIVVSKFMKISDPRTYGSGNPGATNVFRGGNKTAAALTLLGDAIKGWIVVFLCSQVFRQPELITALVALAVLLGHIFPIFLKFKGGKGVATAVGVLFALSWQVATASLLVWICVFAIFKISSLAAIVAAVAAPVFAFIFIPTEKSIYSFAICIIAILVIWRHKSNISRLLSGEEFKLKQDKTK